MSPKSRTPILTTRNRQLGDQWLDWKGSSSKLDLNPNAGKRVFIGILSVCILALGLGAFLIWYLVAPRLAQFHPDLPLVLGLCFLLGWCLIGIWFLLMVLSLWTGKDLILTLGKKNITLTFLVPLVLSLGRRLGLSKDRIGNSFIKVSNSMIRFQAMRVRPQKLLVLIPRCLQKSLLEQIQTLTAALQIPAFIVSGGSKAREIILQHRPEAIIGIACERDLLSGIQEFAGKIPVIGIPNTRPEGPCKNTRFDIQELSKAIQTFTGKDPHLPDSVDSSSTAKRLQSI